MSQSRGSAWSGSYMEDVAVKISEKYKPPAGISVPSGLVERCSWSGTLLASELARYEFSAERAALRSVSVTREARDAARHRRDHRIRLREEAKQREIDRAVATQVKQRLSQLRVTVSDLSYPSTEDISPPPARPRTPDSPSSHDRILKPTPAPLSAPHRVDLLDDPDPVDQYRNAAPIKSDRVYRTGTFYDKSVVDKLSFSDFENDTSSPFDNLELKTINDLELLEQVLNTQKRTDSEMYPSEPTDVPHPPDDAVYGSPVAPYADYRTLAGDMYRDRFEYAHGYAYGSFAAFENVQTPRENYDRRVPVDDISASNTEVSNRLRSKSKSVPDIPKEAEEEEVRVRSKPKERSHNSSPRPVGAVPSPVRVPVEEVLPNPFDDLSPRLRLLCEYICGMGFPIDRVARACCNIGDDDKKIIEYLLIMGQLMDLGFNESKVANALLQHDCNRDKALDALIS